MGNKDSNEAELLAVVKAMELSSSNKDFVGLDFLVESDSASAVSWLSNPRSRPWKFHEFVALVARSSSGLGNVSFCHTLREANSMADLGSFCSLILLQVVLLLWLLLLWLCKLPFGLSASFGYHVLLIKKHSQNGF